MEISGKKTIGIAAETFHEAGKIYTEIGLMFKNAETMHNINEKIEIASQKFFELASIEEKAYIFLNENIYR